MEYVVAIFVFAILPISSLVLCFIKDSKKNRKWLLNTLLIANALLFLSPLLYAYLTTPSGGNMWSENGPGAIMWSYLLILPFCGIVQLVLFILKLKFSKQKPASI